MEGPLRALKFAIEKYPDRVELVALKDLVMDSARQNDRRPAFVKLAVPDEIVKALRGSRDHGDLVLLVRIPAAIGERAESRIVLPGEVET
jgi:hypothetical protein